MGDRGSTARRRLGPVSVMYLSCAGTTDGIAAVQPIPVAPSSLSISSWSGRIPIGGSTCSTRRDRDPTPIETLPRRRPAERGPCFHGASEAAGREAPDAGTGPSRGHAQPLCNTLRHAHGRCDRNRRAGGRWRTLASSSARIVGRLCARRRLRPGDDVRSPPPA